MIVSEPDHMCYSPEKGEKLPFAEHIIRVALLPSFKPPKMDKYDRTLDP